MNHNHTHEAGAHVLASSMRGGRSGMKAEVEHWGSGRYVAWCPLHHEGYGGDKIPTENWAYLHNQNHHEAGAARPGFFYPWR